MILLWWAGVGVAQSALWLRERLSTTTGAARAQAVGLTASMILPVIGLLINWGAAGHRNNYTAELFARNALKSLRPNALLLTNYWDLSSASFYLQHVLNERGDVVLVDKSLMRFPFYLDYLERTYPDLVAKNSGPFTQYKALLRQWVETGRTPRDLPTAYLNVLNGFIDTNLGQRPVYTAFIVAAGDQQEQREEDALLGSRGNQLVPAGFGYRIATDPADRAAQDPQFDLRGITQQKVPLDEIEASVVAVYPIFLQKIGRYMEDSPAVADHEVGARLVSQASELQWLQRFQDERPRLR